MATVIAVLSVGRTARRSRVPPGGHGLIEVMMLIGQPGMKPKPATFEASPNVMRNHPADAAPPRTPKLTSAAAFFASPSFAVGEASSAVVVRRARLRRKNLVRKMTPGVHATMTMMMKVIKIVFEFEGGAPAMTSERLGYRYLIIWPQRFCDDESTYSCVTMWVGEVLTMCAANLWARRRCVADVQT